jgi:hypothetical protein
MAVNTNTVVDFLSRYDKQVFNNAMRLREVLLLKFPDIIEQVDISAKMIAYCYGQKYSELLCTIIPSKKGIKLGFNRGSELPDPDRMIESTGKVSRYMVISSEEPIKSTALGNWLSSAFAVYNQREVKSQ